MRFVSLFAGVGGVDLGLERAGHKCVGQVEIDPYATRVLEKHWPHVPRHGDVRTFRGDEFGPYDLLAGGYPCQPFSVAGNRLGESDERHLWPEVLRIIRHARPRYVLLENVPGHLSLGFGQVLGDLAESGYDAEWDCIPASAVGAPHQRDRVWIVAYPFRARSGMGGRWDGRGSGQERQPAASSQPAVLRQANGSCRAEGSYPSDADVADAASEHCDGGSHQRSGGPRPIPEPRDRRAAPRPVRPWRLSEPPVCRGIDGLPGRVDRLRTLGNAVVPQVAEWIGRRLAALEN